MNSNNADSIKVNGVLFETLVPRTAISLPKQNEETVVQFGVRITNQSDIPHRFDLQRFLPEFLNSQSQFAKIYGLNRNRINAAFETDIPLVEPGESIEFFMNANLSYYSQQNYKFSGTAMYGGFWDINCFEPGEYQVRLSYANSESEINKYVVGKGKTQIAQFWTGEVKTPFVSINLR